MRERTIEIFPWARRCFAACMFVTTVFASTACDSTEPEAKTTVRAQAGGAERSAADTAAPAPETPSSATPENGGIVLTWGTIADNPQEEQDKIEEYGEFLKYMTEHLRDDGVKEVKLTFCHSPYEMGEWIRTGKVDLFDESPFGAYLVHRLGNADEPLLNRWKNGNEKFGAVIFTKKDGGPKSLDELKGKMMVFRGDTSTANYFLPRAHMADLGFTMVEKTGPDDPVAPGTVGYYFVWSSRDKVVETVVDGTVAAGGVSDEFVDQLLGKDVGPAGSARHPRDGAARIQKEDLNILARVSPALRRLATVRRDLDPRVKQAVKDLLVNMHKSPEGQRVLATFGPSSQFSIADTEEVAYQGLLNHPRPLEEEVEKFLAKKP